MTKEVQKELKKILLSMPPMLFLGAGFSLESTNEQGDIPLGNGLKEEIVDKFINGRVGSNDLEDIKHSELPDVCQIIDDTLDKYNELRSFLVERFKHVVPANFHYLLSRYPWEKIYTVNIDDLVENIYRKTDIKLIIQNQENKKLVDDGVEYVKLHGCVNGPSDGMVFSRKEYNNLINGNLNFKHNDLVIDIQNKNFIFIGASMDEPDINYYITRYENAGYFRKGKMIFVEPYPSYALKNRIKALDGMLVECTAEEFLNFVSTINYNPKELEKCKVRLNYSGFFLYKDLVSARDSGIYESRLYHGFDCNWRDVMDDWLFESPYFDRMKKLIDGVDLKKVNSHCIAIYGRQLVGKGCLLKQTGAYLHKKGYTVLEYRGKSFDIQYLFDYMRISSEKVFALLIEDASFYYKMIESIYDKNDTGKKILIVTSSRNYYHIKKKYYLEGTSYDEFEVDDKLDKLYGERIYNKLKEKGYLSYFSSNPQVGIDQILKTGILSNLLTELTYGEGFKSRIKRTVHEDLKNISPALKQLFRELTVFERVDLPYYPSELLTAQYFIDFQCFKEDPNKLPSSTKIIVDFIRVNENGIVLKNKLFVNEMWKGLTDSDKVDIILSVTRKIAPYVSEHENNCWRIIFESLLNEEILQEKLRLRLKDISDIFYQLKNEYGNISYYWLQLGIVEQRKRDFARALNHLLMAKNIRPGAYQIQHAIARNYLKQANNTADLSQAQPLFDKGKTLMLDLIHSTEYYKRKAINYSIHCYVIEWIRYLDRKKISVSNEVVRQMKRYIDMIIPSNDDYVDGLITQFIKMLKKYDKLSVIRFKPGDRYWNALNSTNSFKDYTENDVLVDSYS